MELNNLLDIYTDFRAKFIAEPDYSIDFYSNHAILLNNITQLKDENELRMYIQINYKYLEALNKKHRYNKTIEHAETAIHFIDREIERLNAPDVKNDWYYKFYFEKAVAYYRLNDYTKSTELFKFLVNIDPQDDLYKLWLLYSNHEKKRWLIYSGSIIAPILFVAYLILKPYMSIPIRGYWLIINFIFLIGPVIYDYLVRRSFKNKLRKKS